MAERTPSKKKRHGPETSSNWQLDPSSPQVRLRQISQNLHSGELKQIFEKHLLKNAQEKPRKRPPAPTRKPPPKPTVTFDRENLDKFIQELDASFTKKVGYEVSKEKDHHAKLRKRHAEKKKIRDANLAKINDELQKYEYLLTEGIRRAEKKEKNRSDTDVTISKSTTQSINKSLSLSGSGKTRNTATSVPSALEMSTFNKQEDDGVVTEASSAQREFTQELESRRRQISIQKSQNFRRRGVKMSGEDFDVGFIACNRLAAAKILATTPGERYSPRKSARRLSAVTRKYETRVGITKKDSSSIHKNTKHARIKSSMFLMSARESKEKESISRRSNSLSVALGRARPVTSGSGPFPLRKKSSHAAKLSRIRNGTLHQRRRFDSVLKGISARNRSPTVNSAGLSNISISQLREKALEVLKKNPNQRHREEIEIVKAFFSGIELVPNYSSLSEKQKYNLAAGVTYARREEDYVMFHQGDEGSQFYYILSGNVGVLVKNSITGTKETVAELSQDARFGEIAMFGTPGAKRTATVKCLESSEFVVVTRDRKSVV